MRRVNDIRKVDISVQDPSVAAAEAGETTPFEQENQTVPANGTETFEVYANSSGETRIMYNHSTKIEPDHPAVDYALTVLDSSDNRQFRIFGRPTSNPNLPAIPVQDGWTVEFEWDNSLPVDVSTDMSVMVRPLREAET